MNRSLVDIDQSLYHTERLPYIYTWNIDKLPASSDAVLILWARVFPEKLSRVLQQRVDNGVAVYIAWLSRKILISGDHARQDYDEVNAIRKYIPKIMQTK